MTMKLRVMGKMVATMLFAGTVTTVLAQPSELSVSDLRVTQDQAKLSTIMGTATNTAGRPITDAFLTFNLYDQSGTVVGNAMAHVQNLAVGDHWQFEAKTPLPFARVQVSQIQVFPPPAPQHR